MHLLLSVLERNLFKKKLNSSRLFHRNSYFKNPKLEIHVVKSFQVQQQLQPPFFFWGGGPNALACEPPSHPPTNQPSGKPRQPRNQPGDADHAQGFQVDKASQAFWLRGLPDLLDVPGRKLGANG